MRSRAVESTPDSRRSVLRFVRRVLRPVDCLEEFLHAARFLPTATIIECKLVPRAKFGSLDRPHHYRGPTIAHAGARARVCALKCSVQGVERGGLGHRQAHPIQSVLGPIPAIDRISGAAASRRTAVGAVARVTYRFTMPSKVTRPASAS